MCVVPVPRPLQRTARGDHRRPAQRPAAVVRAGRGGGRDRPKSDGRSGGRRRTVVGESGRTRRRRSTGQRRSFRRSAPSVDGIICYYFVVSRCYQQQYYCALRSTNIFCFSRTYGNLFYRVEFDDVFRT